MNAPWKGYLQIDERRHGVRDTRKGPFVALRDIDLAIARGEFVALIGHSGCGKSTLLNLVAGLLGRRRAMLLRGSARSRARARTAAWCSRTTRCCRG